jgi:hypothetical protein
MHNHLNILKGSRMLIKWLAILLSSASFLEHIPKSISVKHERKNEAANLHTVFYLHLGLFYSLLAVFQMEGNHHVSTTTKRMKTVIILNKGHLTT